MNYRSLTRCNNLKVSEIALGCEGLAKMSSKEMKAMLDRALELGINFIDLCLPNPDLRDNVGRAIAGWREKFCLQRHIGAAWEKGQYLRTREVSKSREAFEDQLNRLGTDYIDACVILGTS